MVGDLTGIAYDPSVVYRELERAGREQLARLAAKLRARRMAVRVVLVVGPRISSSPTARGS